jgi:hypothetical protein
MLWKESIMTVRLCSISFDGADCTSDLVRTLLGTSAQVLKRTESDPGVQYIEDRPAPRALSAASTPKAEK